MLKETASPAAAELAARAARLAPVLRSHARWGEENRRIHDESLEALTEAGIFQMRVPARYGGYESDAGTVLEVIAQVAQGDGSAGWNAAVWSISAWLAGHFPDHVQDEVFSRPVRVCSVLSPTGAAVPTGDGVVINGRWQFVSGAPQSQWQILLAMAPTPDGSSQWPVMALAPMTQLSIEDDWDTMGLRGTGSVTTVATDLFVPQDRVLPMAAVLQGQSASELNPRSPVYRVPMIVTGCTSFTGTAIGLVKAAREAFLADLDRKVAYTDYGSRRESPVVHLVLGEAVMKIEEAESHAARLAALADAKGAAGQEWSVEERARSRAYLGRVFRLAKETAEMLNNESGGSSIYVSAPIQRIARDLHALSQHGLMHAATNTELYGRILCGQRPNTMFL
jgi:alkylation response protein AidB-like acyl-CoA dehydrogenase